MTALFKLLGAEEGTDGHDQDHMKERNGEESHEADLGKTLSSSLDIHIFSPLCLLH